MKKVFSSALALLLVLCMLPGSAFAAVEYNLNTTTCNYYNLISKTDYNLAPGAVESEIVINDEVSDMGVAPVIENGRTFVPYRAGLEALGATVAYDEATQSVTAEMNGVTVVMTIGSNVYTVNGVENTMDVAPFVDVEASRTMVPARFAAQAFGIKVIPTQNPDGTTADVLYVM